jgi:hypothetical protein
MEAKIDELLTLAKKINEKLDYIIPHRQQLLFTSEHKDLSEDDMRLLLELHTHLQKTAITLIKQGNMTANQVASKTHRARAVESTYLNQLESRGYLVSTRIPSKNSGKGGPQKVFKWQPNVGNLRPA